MAPATTTTTTPLSMKLLIDTKSQSVLFAEAGKDVVDFLFSLLTLPAATAVELLGKTSMAGCVSNLYASVEKLDNSYVLPGAAKKALLRPTVDVSPAASTKSSLLLLPAPPPPPPAQPKRFFKCSFYSTGSCYDYVTDATGASCPVCGNPMTKPVHYVAAPAAAAAERQARNTGKGFVQGIVTYTVMDDLTVAPMSAISSITLLNTFAVSNIGDLQEKTVQLGYSEGLKILKASLQSKTVLSDVFLR
ncbi:hypothetical protein ACP70R_030495 [Stipagrostis hirtigluma subsp. patula]